MMTEANTSDGAKVGSTVASAADGTGLRKTREALLQGNREIVTDLYVSQEGGE
jgi:hypothetical protein